MRWTRHLSVLHFIFPKGRAEVPWCHLDICGVNPPEGLQTPSHRISFGKSQNSLDLTYKWRWQLLDRVVVRIYDYRINAEELWKLSSSKHSSVINTNSTEELFWSLYLSLSTSFYLMLFLPLPPHRSVLSNMIVTSYMWPFKLMLRLNKSKNSIPQSYKPHLKCLMATCG